MIKVRPVIWENGVTWVDALWDIVIRFTDHAAKEQKTYYNKATREVLFQPSCY